MTRATKCCYVFLIPLPRFSYIYWLIHFNFNILFRNISAVIFILGRFALVSLSRTSTLTFVSFVKTLTNCFWRIFAFSLSSNFAEVSSFLSYKRGATPVLVLSLLRTCDQNIFALLFYWILIFLSNSFWFAYYCFNFVSGFGVCSSDIFSIWDICNIFWWCLLPV